MLIPGGVRIASIAKVILFSRRKADMITVGKNASGKNASLTDGASRVNLSERVGLHRLPSRLTPTSKSISSTCLCDPSFPLSHTHLNDSTTQHLT